MDIDRRSKNLLDFRPKIEFIEPEQQDSPIIAAPDKTSLEEVNNKRLKIKNLADSVNNLAQAVQLKINDKSKDQLIILDSQVDNAVIRALRRSYPNASNFDRVTFEQYKKCRDSLREYSEKVALRSAISGADIDDAKDQMSSGKFIVGGIGTEEATNGGLRPELDEKNRLVEPLDMEGVQAELLKTLVNMLWKNFIAPLLKKLPIIGGAIPDELVRISKSTREMVGDVQNRISSQAKASTEASGDIKSGKAGTGGGDDSSSTGVGVPLNLPEIDNPTQLQDCNLIVKTYEKGCHASMTEASVFAPFTARLDFIRNFSSTISKQMTSYTDTSSKETVGDKILNSNAIAGSSVNIEPKENENFFTKIGENFFPGGDSIGGFLNSECIPCALRIKFNEELNLKAGVSDIGSYMLEVMEAWLNRALSEIRSLIDMFKNLDKYIDICTLFKFFQDFVCIEDLAKILALLAALMMDLSFELNAVVDLALSLVVPLFVPFLTNLLDSLMKYVLLIVRPIECIIDSIQNMLGKLDYNVLFQNIPAQINLLNPTATAKTQIKIPVLGNLIPEPITVVGGESTFPTVSIDLTPAQRTQRQKEQAAVDKAYKNLQRLKKAANNVDASDPEALERYKKQETQARQEYQDALRERDLSEIGETNLALERFQQQMRGTILDLISFLREGVLKIDSWVSSLFDEFKKMLNLYIGGNGTYITLSAKKLAIVQMIAFINTVIRFLNKDIECDDEGQEVEAFVNSLGKETGFKVFTDEDGNVFIEENLKEINDIANALNIQNPDSLINYTGDDVLDTELSDTLDRLRIPTQLKVKCSLTTSVANQEQVNEWIRELNNNERAS